VNEDSPITPTLEPTDIVKTVSDAYNVLQVDPAGQRRLVVETLSEIGPQHADAVRTTQRHKSLRHGMSITVSLVGIVAAVGSAAAGILTQQLAAVIGVVVAAGFGLRALEVWKGEQQ
jgi:hypothetical protein